MAASCYHRAAALLAARAHFRRELAAKLTARGYDESEIAATLDRLAAAGLLDDRRTAEGFVAERLARGPQGRARLEAELAQRGVDDADAAAALDAQLPDDDLEAAREAAAAWERRGGTDSMALGRHLARKGFSRRAIVAVLRGRPDAPDVVEIDE